MVHLIALLACLALQASRMDISTGWGSQAGKHGWVILKHARQNKHAAHDAFLHVFSTCILSNQNPASKIFFRPHVIKLSLIEPK